MNDHPSIRRVAVYTRVSTHEQAVEGVGLSAQESRGRQWADLYGAEVVEVVGDAGWSGGTLERPGISRLWELVNEGAVDGIVVAELSRITRSSRDFANLVADLRQAGVALVSIRESLNTGDTCGQLVASIMAAVAQFEREQTAERTREALAQVRREGRHIGRPPVGFTSKDGELVPDDPARIDLALRAVRMSTDGATLRAIADTFNAEGIPPGSGRRDARWHAPAVSRLLRAGRLVP